MKGFIKIFCLTCVFTVSLFAQTQTDEYRKNEFYVGYSHQQIEGGDRHYPVNGFEGAYVRNVHRYLGIKADFSAGFRGEDFRIAATDSTTGPFSYRGRVDTRRYNILGGIQIKDNASQKRFKPFVHALAGVVVNRYQSSDLVCTQGVCPDFVDRRPGGNFTNTNFAMAVGGGLDIKINRRLDFRALQIDYNPVFGGGSVQHNVRFGIGFVIK